MIRAHAVRSLATLAAWLALAVPLRGAHAADTAPWGQDRGFSLGLKFVVETVGADEASDPGDPNIDDIGAGVGLVAGYSWSPHVHTRFTLGSATHGTSVSDVDVLSSFGALEAHWRFLPDRQVCPYVFGSLGGADVRADQGGNHVQYSGAAAGLGAGLLCGLTRHWVVDLTGRIEGVNWNTAKWAVDQPGGGQLQYQTPIEDSGGMLRLELGMLYQF